MRALDTALQELALRHPLARAPDKISTARFTYYRNWRIAITVNK